MEFCKLYKELRISPLFKDMNEVVFYCDILSHRNNKQRYFPSQDYIYPMLKCSRSTLIRMIKSMVKRGLIKLGAGIKMKGGWSYEYIPLWSLQEIHEYNISNIDQIMYQNMLDMD